MKKLLFLFLIIALLFGYGILENHYIRKGKVVQVEGDLYIIEDTCGYIWASGNKEELSIGDHVILYMDTAGTQDDIYDDIIVYIKKK